MDRFRVVQRGLPRLPGAHEGRAPGALPAPQDPAEHRPLPLDRHALCAEGATLYAGIVDALRSAASSTYARLFTDIRECIDEAHRDGTILDVVLSDLPRFVATRRRTSAQTLHKFRSAGKKLFLLTNSRWPFTEKMMTYLLGDAMPEYPSLRRHYFDVIVVAAQKPSVLPGAPPAPASATARPSPRPATAPLERGAIYESGNLNDFEKFLNISGDRVSTSAITSTATSSAPRRRARGARR